MTEDRDFQAKTRHIGRKEKKLGMVEIRYVPTPDADARLSRAMGILLKAAGRDISESRENTNTKKEEPPCQAPAEDALPGGDEGDNSHDS